MKSRSQDEILISRARSGDVRSFEILVRQHQSLVYNLALRMLGNVEDAEDVLQETFLALHKNLKKFRGRSSLSTYLFRLATNFSLMKLRKHKNRQEEKHTALEEALEHADPRGFGLDNILDSELRGMLNSFLLELEEKERAAVILADVEGLPGGQAAKILGLSLPAFKSRLHRAREKLRLRLLPYIKQ